MKHKHIAKQFIQLPSKLLLTLTVVTTLFFYTEVSANASVDDVHEVADICMQANRILKDYALVGMGVDYHNPAKDLKKNLKLIEKEFKDLEGRDLGEKLHAEIIEIKESWQAMKSEFEKKPEKSKMHDLLKQVEKYTHRCYEVAEDLAKDSKVEGEHYVVLVAQLGMESQRIAAEYIAHAWGVEDPLYEGEIKEIISEVKGIIKELSNADDKLVSKEIKEKLAEVDKQFIAFSVMATSTSGRFMPSSAEKMASSLFQIIQEILKKEQELVEGKVSGYFLPIADEKTAGEIFRVITGIIYIDGGVTS